MHKKDFFPFIFFSYHSFSLSYLEHQIIFSCRDIGPATAILDPRPRHWTRDRDCGPATISQTQKERRPHFRLTCVAQKRLCLRSLILLLHRRITPAVLSIFSPKKTRCLSHNRRRSEGLILLSQTTRIKLWRRLFLQWQDFRTAWTFARMKFLRSNGFFVKWHLSFCFVDMARTFKRVSGSAFYEPAFWTNKFRLKKKSDFKMDVIKW